MPPVIMARYRTFMTDHVSEDMIDTDDRDVGHEDEPGEPGREVADEHADAHQGEADDGEPDVRQE